MTSKTNRLKTALRRVFKVRGRFGKSSAKHVALVDSPGADTANSGTETASTDVPTSHRIPDLDLLVQRKPVDMDLMTCFSIETEAPPTHVRQGSALSLACNSPETMEAPSDLQKDADMSKLPLPLPKLLKRSCSVPTQDEHQTHARRASELPTVYSSKEMNSIDSLKEVQMRNSPTGVSDLFPPAGRGTPPKLPGASNYEATETTRVRSTSDLGEASASRNAKCVIPKHNHDAQKANEAFLALKKELEKNEFTKAAQVIKQVHSQEGSVMASPPSLDSTGKPKQKQPNQQHTDTYEIIPSAPSVDSIPAAVETDTIDNILGITPVVSQSDSLDSDCSSYSSFDMESIGEITIDSTTLRLIEMHKNYCDNAKVNLNHPARMKKSNMRVSSAYAPIEVAKSDSSVMTEVNRRLTWYDEGENLNKPFTLKTDETFDDSMSVESSKHSFEGIHRSLKMVDQFLIPFSQEGLGKLLDSLNCGGANGDDISMASAQVSTQ